MTLADMAPTRPSRTIMMVNQLYPPMQVGGAEKSVSLLAEAMVRAGHRVVAVTLGMGNEREDEERNGVTVVRLPLDNLFWAFDNTNKESAPKRMAWHVLDMWNLKAAKRFAAIVEEFRPDVVHTNVLVGFSVAIWAELKKRNIPIIHTLRDYSMLCGRSTLFRHNHICETRCTDCQALTAVRKFRSDLVSAVASNSDYVIKQHLKHGYFKGRPASVIFNIADLSAKPAAADTPTDELVFGFIGQVNEEKGIGVVLEATRKMKRSNWRLKIAGRGPAEYIDGLKARYGDPRIEWLGFAKPEEFYTSIDTSLIASIWPEPLPRTLIESFAYGRSALCARSGGIPEIASIGKCVAEYDPFDSDTLAQLMDAAIDDMPRWKRAEPADPAFFAAFSEAEIVGRYSTLYEQAIADK
ncbi:glycosyltransferase family 4 protein [Asticcacaulis sp. AND118]|uniref:glycosyltransferase family 4 protein n=1 Tax=Asticcacaulis sp. AND118 TaxID=2840468 RepID=UPI001D00132B|nr:glycosyltransferase family 4 protein [Asticcacaulis sp. AND118]UDF05056.1 glycosyltransferase family 4 protein [Asticcacaulis sp. AND118]